MKMHCRHTDDEVHTSGHERTQAGTTSHNSKYTFYSKALHSSLLDGPTVCMLRTNLPVPSPGPSPNAHERQPRTGATHHAHSANATSG